MKNITAGNTPKTSVYICYILYYMLYGIYYIYYMNKYKRGQSLFVYSNMITLYNIEMSQITSGYIIGLT